jgi:glucokinase
MQGADKFGSDQNIAAELKVLRLMRISDPLICNACGKVYLEGHDNGLCDDPRCLGAKLDHLLGFVSYRRDCKTHRGIETNDIAVRVKDRVEKVLHARRIGGGFFIDKTGIEREDFEKKIAKTIKSCAGRVFLLILTPGALDPRENEDEDWLRKEIRLAVEHKLVIVPIIASKYRQDDDFKWPEKLTTEIAILQKENVNLSFIGDLDERYLVDTTQNIASEIIRSIGTELVTMLQADPGKVQGKARPRPLSSGTTEAENRDASPRAIGLDIGGSKIRGCVVEFLPDGSSAVCSNEYVVDVRKPSSARTVIEQVKGIIQEMYSGEGLENSPPIGIGIAAAGQVDLRAGVLKFAPALALRNFSLKSLLATAYRGIEVRVDNDVRCASRCELYLGAGQDFDNFVCIFIGTGVGSGVSIDGRIVFGSNYCAGEIGHMKISSDGPMCNCGQIGCLETFVNAGALINRAHAQAIAWKSRGLETLLSDSGGENTPRSIVTALEMGDAAAQEVADEIGRKLGIGIANCLNILNPGAVVLGGGLMSGFFAHMSDGIARGIRENALSDVANTSIVHSQFSDTGAALGAALLFHPESHWPF